jgi:hypothetical protein
MGFFIHYSLVKIILKDMDIYIKNLIFTLLQG